MFGSVHDLILGDNPFQGALCLNLWSAYMVNGTYYVSGGGWQLHVKRLRASGGFVDWGLWFSAFRIVCLQLLVYGLDFGLRCCGFASEFPLVVSGDVAM